MSRTTETAERFFLACGCDIVWALQRLYKAQDILTEQGRTRGADQVQKMIDYLKARYL